VEGCEGKMGNGDLLGLYRPWRRGDGRFEDIMYYEVMSSV